VVICLRRSRRSGGDRQCGKAAGQEAAKTLAARDRAAEKAAIKTVSARRSRSAHRTFLPLNIMPLEQHDGVNSHGPDMAIRNGDQDTEFGHFRFCASSHYLVQEDTISLLFR
jgi:hypothetical protein